MSNERLPLFRSEALEASRRQTIGRIILIRPLSFTVLTSVAVLIAGAIGWFFFWGRYTQHTTLVGQLVPITGVVGVRAPQAGTVIEKYVSEGDAVEVGQVLYIMSSQAAGRIQVATQGAEGTLEKSANGIFTVHSPVAGTATAVSGEPGQAVDLSKPLLMVISDHVELEAHLLAPSRAVGLLQPGSSVMLRYEAYPYQRFGHFRGVLTSISSMPTAGRGEREPQREPLYLVRVALTKQSVMAYGEQRNLRIGMTVHGDVLQDTRRLYEWVVEPLYSIAGTWHEAGKQSRVISDGSL